MIKGMYLATSLTLMMSLSLIAMAQQASTPQTAHLKGHGCLKAGNASGWYVVNDYKAHRK